MTAAKLVPMDNTPWWIHDTTRGTGNGLGRCNPYGYEDGQIRVQGGMASPQHEPYIYYCRNQADARYQITCTAGHAGQLTLCYAHVYMIRKRMSGVCPRCAWPPRAREIHEAMGRLQREAAALPPSAQDSILARLWDLQAEMNELAERGVISRGGPLRLTEVS